ncbi:DNA polymerase IV [Clostridium felsineum]|uniref:Y-family DNA polymerase n=1 Tax=Clostridium felsineum TaxID=36839 RepID=UPI00214D818B|nr:DNA polymerase IV [Clostridium felsineum]MCR3761750.1 DNA polymerase IV [Clostridium felsineum]
MSKVIFHVDVNSAFLSWTAVEKIKNGEKVDIRKVPSVIGGDEKSRHGVVLAKSTPAKKYGIVTGESLYQARKKCPNILVFPPRFEIYRRSSENMMNLIKRFTPHIEKYSIDECFMDVTNDLRGMEDVEFANIVRERIKNELGFTVNVGVSTNRLLAKMASELNKPDKVNTLYDYEIKKKMWPLPVGELFMVGKSMKKKLNELHIKTIGELAAYDANILKAKFKSHGKIVWEYANGIDNSDISRYRDEIKCISNETTLSNDLTKIEEIHNILISLCENLGKRLREQNKYCTSIAVSIRTSDFRNYSHQKTFKNSINSTKDIILYASKIFSEMWGREPIRLLGVQLSGLCSSSNIQISMFDEEINPKNEMLDKTLDAIRKKYGDNAVMRSVLMPKDK